MSTLSIFSLPLLLTFTLATAVPPHTGNNSTNTTTTTATSGPKCDYDASWIAIVPIIVLLPIGCSAIAWNFASIRLLNQIRTTPPELREAVMKGKRQRWRMKNANAEYLDPKEIPRLYGGTG